MECAATTTLLYTDRTKHYRAIDEQAMATAATTISRCWGWLRKQQNFINNISFSAILSHILSSLCLVFRGMFGRTDRVLDRFWKFNSLLAYLLCFIIFLFWWQNVNCSFNVCFFFLLSFPFAMLFRVNSYRNWLWIVSSFFYYCVFVLCNRKKLSTINFKLQNK